MISLASVHDRLAGALSKAGDDVAATRAAIHDYMRYLFANYAELDESARQEADLLVSELLAQARARAQGMADSPERRDLIRQIAIAQGEHFQVGKVLDRLNETGLPTDAYMSAAEAACIETLQDLADVVHDAKTMAPRTEARFVIPAMLMGVLDDCVATLKLARHGLSEQGAAVLRTSAERLDLVELFLKDESWVTTWLHASKDERWSKLRPNKVRKLIGLPADEVSAYAYLSEAGTHPTFTGVKGRAFRKAESDRITLSVGGCRAPWSLLPLYAECVYKSGLALLHAVKWCETLKVLPENAGRVERMEARKAAFMKEHVGPALAALAEERAEPGKTVDDQ